MIDAPAPKIADGKISICVYFFRFFSSKVMSQFSSSFASINSMLPILTKSVHDISFLDIFSKMSSLRNDFPSFTITSGRRTLPALQLTYNLCVAPSNSGL